MKPEDIAMAERTRLFRLVHSALTARGLRPWNGEPDGTGFVLMVTDHEHAVAATLPSKKAELQRAYPPDQPVVLALLRLSEAVVREAHDDARRAAAEDMRRELESVPFANGAAERNRLARLVEQIVDNDHEARDAAQAYVIGRVMSDWSREAGEALETLRPLEVMAGITLKRPDADTKEPRPEVARFENGRMQGPSAYIAVVLPNSEEYNGRN